MTATYKNTGLWDALATTDKKHTKPFKRAGGFSGTATKPIYLYQKMTEALGPVGIGWGYSEPTYQLVNGANNEVLVYCWLSLWFVDPATGQRSEPFFGVGGDVVVKNQSNGLKNDDEAFKKAFTDALGNAMKHMGMSADVHMGQFDGSKYQSDEALPEAPRKATAPKPASVNIAANGADVAAAKMVEQINMATTVEALESTKALIRPDFLRLPREQQKHVASAAEAKAMTLASLTPENVNA